MTWPNGSSAPCCGIVSESKNCVISCGRL